jgi:hypothetical protein
MAKKAAFSVAEMKALWKSRYVGKSRGRNDRIEKNRGGISYYLFRNEIAWLNPATNQLEISDCNHMSITTKDRLNGLLVGTGYYITQKDWIWYLVSKRHGVQKWAGSLTVRGV